MIFIFVLVIYSHKLFLLLNLIVNALMIFSFYYHELYRLNRSALEHHSIILKIKKKY